MHIEIVPLLAGMLVGHVLYRTIPLSRIRAHFALRGLRARIATTSTYFGPSPAKCFGTTPDLELRATKTGVHYRLRDDGALFGFASGTVRNTAAGVDQLDAEVARNSARHFADANRAHAKCAPCSTS